MLSIFELSFQFTSIVTSAELYNREKMKPLGEVSDRDMAMNNSTRWLDWNEFGIYAE